MSTNVPSILALSVIIKYYMLTMNLYEERILWKNIFLHYENILDWKVDESLIKVESQKFNELTETISDFKEIKINDKYEFKKLLEKTFKLHENICKEITEWLENNETFFDYKDNLGI